MTTSFDTANDISNDRSQPSEQGEGIDETHGFSANNQNVSMTVSNEHSSPENVVTETPVEAKRAQNDDEYYSQDLPSAIDDGPRLIVDQDVQQNLPSSDSSSASSSSSQSNSSSSVSSTFLPDGLRDEDEEDAASILDDTSDDQPTTTVNQRGSSAVSPSSPLPSSDSSNNDSNNDSSVSEASNQQQRQRRNREFRRMQRRERRRYRQRQRRYLMNLFCAPCMFLFTMIVVILLIIFMGLPFLMFLICLLSAYYCCTSDPLPPRVLIRAMMDTEDWNTNNNHAGQQHRRFNSKADIEKELVQRVCMGSFQGTIPKRADEETTEIVQQIIGANIKEVVRSYSGRVHWKYEENQDIAESSSSNGAECELECLVFSKVLSEEHPRSIAVQNIQYFDRSKKALKMLLPKGHQDAKISEAEMKGIMADLKVLSFANLSANKFLSSPNVEGANEENAPEENMHDDDSVRERGTVCDICLIGFEPEDVIAWSSNPKCDHAYHTDCISDWLMRQPTCPSCRQEFLPEAKKDEESSDDGPTSSPAEAVTGTAAVDVADTSSRASSSSEIEVPTGSPDESLSSSEASSSSNNSSSQIPSLAADTEDTDPGAQASEASDDMDEEMVDLRTL